MDLTMIANFLGTINPLAIGGIAGGTLLVCLVILYIKNNKGEILSMVILWVNPVILPH